ncbi:hypothetical protein AVEN_173243-1 [Araneus ventricosus]|uniref:Uncharacterized protein n=1 Tax=Araneus ventricosus TaxID=182803 RepID=A0A4Y2V309_ARAVE|nr:hypothetical protein AVEN_173243-1 [Araneus ventricosus]
MMMRWSVSRCYHTVGTRRGSKRRWDVGLDAGSLQPTTICYCALAFDVEGLTAGAVSGSAGRYPPTLSRRLMKEDSSDDDFLFVCSLSPARQSLSWQ